ncbi:FAD-binding oxidoreductase [Aspergillus fijiensis CBS 313.89]|uniref:FAD-binding domain-containing protein n=1 Tax=Aspergillus fijiensis CBS 313.89 TaxID=1448319 RepID=A0A8G1W2S2_9EURO|nr:FAD-binding domain-containing protein [Aspergillus fijiensis CBS 313.89]RAK81767.1 FAD-binding domain-containing protein [Aspergillus fijiensis CBS 313.89]
MRSPHTTYKTQNPRFQSPINITGLPSPSTGINPPIPSSSSLFNRQWLSATTQTNPTKTTSVVIRLFPASGRSVGNLPVSVTFGTSVTGDPHAGQKGCTIGNYPACVVNATEPSHVQSALSFAKKHNVRLSIKNTGHGCKTNASVHGSPKIAATLGAGVQDEEMYAALAKHNAISVGGTSPTVGIFGWATGGGHGLATGQYGMGADNISEAEMITPQGDHVTVNACQNQDLFWAIRGGGGTFGVIL